MKKEIFICFSTDNHYIEYTVTALQSVIENSAKSTVITAYIIAEGLSKENQKWISKFNEFERINIIVQNLSYNFFEKMEIFKKVRLPDHITNTTFYRLLLPEIFPDIERIIYLDSDIIVLGDLTSLFEVVFPPSKMIAAVEDVNYIKLRSNLGYSKNFSYVNAGILLLDLNKMRQKKSYERMELGIESNLQKYFICDQDILNDLFYNEIEVISYSWNFFHEYHELGKSFIPSNLKDYNESCRDPKIIHFVGKTKPWHLDSKHPYERKFKYFHEKALKVKGGFPLFLKKILKIEKNNIQKKIIIMNRVVVIHERNLEKSTLKILGVKIWQRYKVKKLILKLNETLKQLETLQRKRIESDNFRIVWLKKLNTVYIQRGSSKDISHLLDLTLSDINNDLMSILYLLNSRNESDINDKLISHVKKYGTDVIENNSLWLSKKLIDNGFFNEKLAIMEDISAHFNQFNFDALRVLLTGKTVAIIGNSPNLLKEKKGTEIDGYDVVIRINNYDISEQFSEYTGRKVNIWARGCFDINLKFSKDPVEAVLLGQNMYYALMNSNNNVYKSVFSKVSTYDYPDDIYLELKEKSGIDFPTTGLSILWLIYKLRHTVAKIGIYGFSESDGNKYLDHYYDLNEDVELLKKASSPHDLENEIFFIKLLSTEIARYYS